MRRKKSTLELTPLLDVVLILLFVFMLMLANQVNESTKIKEDAEDSVALSQQEKDDALNSLREAEDELAALNDDYEELHQASSDVLEQLEMQRALSEEQQETAENLAKAAAEFIDANEYDIKQLLDENEAAADELLDNMAIDDIAEELLKYEALSRQFYFVDLELKSANNRLFINDKSTTVGISSADLEDEEYMQDKIDEIKDLIEENLEGRQGGSQMVFITLKVYDRYVRQDAWQVTWDAIGEIQEKYGTDKIFRTHITITKN